MSIINDVKEEILRLASKEANGQIAKARKAAAQYQVEVAQLKRIVRQQQREINYLRKQQPVETDELAGVRYSARSVRAQRRRLGLSTAEYGRLIGVSGLTIHNWEHEKSRPRRAQLAALVGIRGISKKLALARLAELP